MSNRLPVLAATANAAHKNAEAAIRSAAAHARAAGDALLEAKALVGHGQWTAWLQENFSGDARTAQRYMRVAKNWQTIAEKTTRMSDLSVNEALRLLEGRDELELALVMQAESDALEYEFAFLGHAVETAELAGLQWIIGRTGEIIGRHTGIRLRAARELGRLLRELAEQEAAE